MTLAPPPTYDVMVEGNGKPKLSWLLFFNQQYNGDSGELWTPTFQNLGTTGAPVIEGKYYQLSNYLAYFTITITPGIDTSSVAGSTYCDNVPLLINGDGVCCAVTGTSSAALGVIQGGTGRIYTPVWTNVTTPVTILGLVEAR